MALAHSQSLNLQKGPYTTMSPTGHLPTITSNQSSGSFHDAVSPKTLKSDETSVKPKPLRNQYSFPREKRGLVKEQEQLQL